MTPWPHRASGRPDASVSRSQRFTARGTIRRTSDELGRRIRRRSRLSLGGRGLTELVSPVTPSPKPGEHAGARAGPCPQPGSPPGSDARGQRHSQSLLRDCRSQAAAPERPHGGPFPGGQGARGRAQMLPRERRRRTELRDAGNGRAGTRAVGRGSRPLHTQGTWAPRSPAPSRETRPNVSLHAEDRTQFGCQRDSEGTGHPFLPLS